MPSVRYPNFTPNLYALGVVGDVDVISGVIRCYFSLAAQPSILLLLYLGNIGDDGTNFIGEFGVARIEVKAIYGADPDNG